MYRLLLQKSIRRRRSIKHRPQHPNLTAHLHHRQKAPGPSSDASFPVQPHPPTIRAEQRAQECCECSGLERLQPPGPFVSDVSDDTVTSYDTLIVLVLADNGLCDGSYFFNEKDTYTV
ncbi:Uncharacterized protein Rs2_12739 [Raphanus sativus]|nr:Uncharacterized protein Rs2_12739 [Raphanus sativus]